MFTKHMAGEENEFFDMELPLGPVQEEEGSPRNNTIVPVDPSPGPDGHA